METKAREAFFDSIVSRKAVSQHLILKIRRECLVKDSLRGVSEVVGSEKEEIKKSLQIKFSDEEGIDAGGYAYLYQGIISFYFQSYILTILGFGKNGFCSWFEILDTVRMT